VALYHKKVADPRSTSYKEQAVQVRLRKKERKEREKKEEKRKKKK